MTGAPDGDRWERNHARSFLRKAEDAIVTALTGSTSKGKDDATAAKDLARALAERPQATVAERGLGELLAAKGDVEYAQP
jgi:hypothetical protein